MTANFLHLSEKHPVEDHLNINAVSNDEQLMSISGTINSTTESAAYTHDNLGRLVTSNQTSNGASAQRRFSYDRWGNRTGVWDAVTGGTQILVGRPLRR